MYYIYKQVNGLPCITEHMQMGMELIATTQSYEEAEKILKLCLLGMKQRKNKKRN